MFSSFLRDFRYIHQSLGSMISGRDTALFSSLCVGFKIYNAAFCEITPSALYRETHPAMKSEATPKSLIDATNQPKPSSPILPNEERKTLLVCSVVTQFSLYLYKKNHFILFGPAFWIASQCIAALCIYAPGQMFGSRNCSAPHKIKTNIQIFCIIFLFLFMTFHHFILAIVFLIFKMKLKPDSGNCLQTELVVTAD